MSPYYTHVDSLPHPRLEFVQLSPQNRNALQDLLSKIKLTGPHVAAAETLHDIMIGGDRRAGLEEAGAGRGPGRAVNKPYHVLACSEFSLLIDYLKQLMDPEAFARVLDPAEIMGTRLMRMDLESCGIHL